MIESGVSREIISKYERGLAILSVDAAKKIVGAFGVSFGYLVEEGLNISFDKMTIKRLQKIQNLKPDCGATLFFLTDMVIWDTNAQKAYMQ